MRGWSKSFAFYVFVLMGHGCDSDLSIQTSSVAVDCQKNPSDPSCATVDDTLAITLDSSITNNYDLVAKWLAGDGIDSSRGYSFRLSQDASCATSVYSYDEIKDNEKKLDSIPDGHYYLCLFAKAKDGREVAAKNNGLELTIDRTPPVLTVDEHILTNQSFKFNAVIEDLLPTMTSWQQVSGPGNVTFDDANSATPTISMTVDGSYALQMQTADQAGNQSTKMITVVWDTTPPTVAAIADQLAGMPLLITPAVTSTLFDDPLTYSWSVVSGPGIITPAMPYPAKNITVSANTNGNYVLRFAVTDAAGNTATRDVNFAWDNTVPTVNVGADIVAKASAAIDATTNSGVTFSWTQVSGPGTVTFTDPTAEDTSVTADADGVYVLRLSVTNASASQTVFDELTFTWDTTNPVFQTLLADQVSKDPINVTADVSDAHTTVTYVWSKVSGPGNVIFSQANAASTTITVDQDGDYVLRLTATDQAGNSVFDDLTYSRDTDPPTLTSLLGANEASDGIINAADVASVSALLTLSASGQTSTKYTEVLADSALTCDSDKTYSESSVPAINTIPAVDGAYAVCVELKDDAGNTVYGKSQQITRDVTAPVFTSLVGANEASGGTVNAADVASGSALLTLSASGQTSTMYTEVLADSALTCDSGKTYSESSVPAINTIPAVDGAYAVCVELKDDAGNTTYGKSQQIVRDVNAPTLTSLVGANEASDGSVNAAEASSASALLTLSASGQTSTKYTEVLVDSALTCDSGQDYSESSIPTINTIPAADDVYAVCVELKDAAGNTTYGKSQQIKRDVTAPPALTAFSGASDPDGDGVLLSFTFPASTADYSTVEIRRLAGATAPDVACNNGTVIQTYTTGTGFSASSYGDTGVTAGTAYSYRVCILDAAANLTASNTAANIKAPSQNDWDFSSAVNYTFNALYAQISGGVARLLQIDQIDDDNSASGFAGGQHDGTKWNGTDALTLTASASRGGPGIYNDFYDGVDTTNLEYLLHFDGVGYTDGSSVVNSTGKGDGAFSTGDSNWKTVGGKFGKAIKFDGANDSISIADSAINQFSGDFTFIAWIKLSSASGIQRIISKQEGGGLSYKFLLPAGYES